MSFVRLCYAGKDQICQWRRYRKMNKLLQYENFSLYLYILVFILFHRNRSFCCHPWRKNSNSSSRMKKRRRRKKKLSVRFFFCSLEKEKWIVCKTTKKNLIDQLRFLIDNIDPLILLFSHEYVTLTRSNIIVL